MSSTTETIKARLSIADVVGSYVKLENAGQNLKARCPFHNEKTPSFVVSPARNSYYCFGCGAKGDIFTFVEQFEGLDFSGALRMLAERAGVPLQVEDKNARDHRERLFEVLEEATRFYEETLLKTPEALSYLASRGMLRETTAVFRLGFAPDTWRSAATFLARKGYTERELEEAGLIKRTDRGYYDRFRGRIIFPIFDPSGRVVGFSGRIFVPEGSKPAEGEPAAKYLNSPETSLFRKSEVLYGLDKAKFNIRKAGSVLLVEGQMDLTLAHQAGFSNAVALSGTALTEAQVTLMRRLTSSLVLALDADEAGVLAAGRSAHVALAQGMEVRVVRLPLGSDPADLVRDDPERLREAIAGAKHVIEFYLAVLGEKGHDERTFQLETSRVVLPFVAALERAIEQTHFVKLVARRINSTEEAIWQDLARFRTGSASVQGTRSYSNQNDPQGFRGGERVRAPSETRDRRQTLLLGLASIIAWQESLAEHGGGLVTGAIRERIGKAVGGEVHDFLPTEHMSDKEALIFEAELLYGNVEDLAMMVEEMLAALEEESRRIQFAEAIRELRAAEAEGNAERIERALAACDQLSKQLVGR